MFNESDSLIQMVIVALVTVVGGIFVKRYFKNQDTRQAIIQEKVATSFIKITTVTRIEHPVYTTLQDAVIFGFYGACLLTGLLEAALFFAALSGEVMSLFDVLMSVVYISTISWFILTCTYVGVLPLRRRNARVVPHFLHSLRYSLTTTLMVDQVGFDGLFALPWRRVESIERIDELTLTIMYCRRPRFLTALIRANRLTLRFGDVHEVNQIISLWQAYATGSARN